MEKAIEIDIVQGCPICHKQGKMILMEGRKDDKNITCAIHGDISRKYFHDIFIDSLFRTGQSHYET